MTVVELFLIGRVDVIVREGLEAAVFAGGLQGKKKKIHERIREEETGKASLFGQLASRQNVSKRIDTS
eukprot:940552-Prorocentrum_minimum.AAC.1